MCSQTCPPGKAVKCEFPDKQVYTDPLECLVDIHLLSPQLKRGQVITATRSLVNGLEYSEVEVPKLVFTHRVKRGRFPRKHRNPDRC